MRAIMCRRKHVTPLAYTSTRRPSAATRPAVVSRSVLLRAMAPRPSCPSAVIQPCRRLLHPRFQLPGIHPTEVQRTRSTLKTCCVALGSFEPPTKQQRFGKGVNCRDTRVSQRPKYDDHDHIGYGLDGKRIAKKVSARGDGLDRYLASKDDPNYRRTVYDAKNDREVVLTDRQMELIRNMLSGGYAHPEFNDHQEFVPFFSQNVQIHPLTHAPAPKARFLPDKWERQKVLKIAQAIKEGRIVIGKLCEVV